MVNKYKLVNPYIKGEFESKVQAKNSVEAAKTLYKNLSEHFNNNVPNFYFTIQKGGSGKGKFYHFVVTEKKTGDNVDYSIKEFEIKGEDTAMKNYLSNFESFKGRYKGVGGAKRAGSRKGSRKGSKRSSKKLEDEISSESDDYYRQAVTYSPVTTQPIYYMYYDPIVYNVESIFLPTFYAYVVPYFELNTKTGSYTVYA